MTVETRGDRDLALRFDTFPERAHKKLADRVTTLIDRLKGKVEGTAPFLTGRLRSEVTGTVYGDKPTRVAGYVEIYAPGAPAGEYAKAATLEYGTDKPRRAFERTASLVDRFGRSRRRVLDKASRAVHIDAYRYLRGPFAEMKDEAYAELTAALNEAAQE